MASSSSVICPFCAIHCDLHLDRLDTLQCNKATVNFHALLDAPLVARIGSEPATSEAVLQFTKNNLANRACPSVATSGTDLSTAKILEQLVNRGKICLHLDETVSEAAWRTAVSREGILSATLADIRRHADVLWVIGEITATYPRLMQQIDASEKQVVASERLHADTLAELFFSLRHSAADRQSELERSIRSASYLAILIGPDAFDPKDAVSTSTLLAKMVWFLNKEQRAVAIQIDRAATNRALTAWRTNTGVVSISNSMFAAETLDIRIGNECFDERKAMLQIGGIDRGMATADAYVPARLAGIDTTAMVIRGDSTVSLSLEQFQETQNQTVGDLLTQLL